MNKYNIVAADHSLAGGMGLDLLIFQAKSPLRPLGPGEKRYDVDIKDLPAEIQRAARGRKCRSCIECADGSRKFEAVWSGKRAVYSVALDMGPVGWPTKLFLFTKVSIRGFCYPDPAHRRFDNVLVAACDSGLSSARAERMVTNEVLNGPWEGSGNYKSLKEAATEYFKLRDHRDPLFRSLYPRICQDLFGEGMLMVGTEEHYRNVWALLPNLAIFKSRGRVTKVGRWFQWEEKSARMLQFDTVVALILSYVSLVKGWDKSFHDTPAGGAFKKLAEQPALAPHVAVDARRKMKIKHSNIVGTNLNSKAFQNTQHVALHILGDRLSRAATVAMCALAEPVKKEHGHTQIALSTTLGHANWYQEMAAGIRRDSTVGIVEQMCSPDLADAMHMDELFEQRPASLEELITMSFSFGRRVLMEEGVFCLSYHLGVPGRFFALNSKDPAIVAQAAQYIHDLWVTLTKAEDVARSPGKKGKVVKKHLAGMIWPAATWCREVCLALHEGGGQALPSDVAEELEGIASGPLWTTHVEKSFNFIRRQTDRSMSRSISSPAVWHRTCHNGLTEEMGLSQVVPTAIDKLQKLGSIQQAMFTAKSREDMFSLGASVLDDWVAGGTWASPSAMNFFKQFMMNSALFECDQDFSRLGDIWLSLLADGDCALTLASEAAAGTNTDVYVVLGATEMGVLTWSAKLLQGPGDVTFICMSTDTAEVFGTYSIGFVRGVAVLGHTGLKINGELIQ